MQHASEKWGLSRRHAEHLLENVWGTEYTDDKEILWVCISRLRQKLEENPKKPSHIITRSGAGYTMPDF